MRFLLYLPKNCNDQITKACDSNGDLSVVNANLKTLRTLHLVDFCITGEDIQHDKPDPEPYLLAVEKLSLHPTCLAIVDSIVGVLSETLVGVRTVAWPLSNTIQKGSEDADYFIQHPSEFPWELIYDTKVEG